MGWSPRVGGAVSAVALGVVALVAAALVAAVIPLRAAPSSGSTGTAVNSGLAYASRVGILSASNGDYPRAQSICGHAADNTERSGGTSMVVAFETGCILGYEDQGGPVGSLEGHISATRVGMLSGFTDPLGASAATGVGTSRFLGRDVLSAQPSGETSRRVGLVIAIALLAPVITALSPVIGLAGVFVVTAVSTSVSHATVTASSTLAP